MRVETFPEGPGGSGHRALWSSLLVVIFRFGVLISKCTKDFLFEIELPVFYWERANKIFAWKGKAPNLWVCRLSWALATCDLLLKMGAWPGPPDTQVELHALCAHLHLEGSVCDSGSYWWREWRPWGCWGQGRQKRRKGGREISK